MHSPWQELLLGPHADVVRARIDTVRKSTKLDESGELVYKNEALLSSLIMKQVTSSDTVGLISEWVDKLEPIKTCSQYKEMGNQYFKEKKYRESLSCYTKGATVSLGEERALLIGNRSAALFFLGQYEDCLADISDVLNLVPAATKAKLLARQDKCKEDMNRKLTTPKIVSPVLPELLKGESKEIDSTSAALKIACTPEKGRHLLAKETVRSGDTMFREEPYIAVLLAKNSISYCSFCFAKLHDKMVCCKLCGDAVYCSADCRKSDTTHRFECRHLPFLYSVGIAHLALKIVAQTGVEKIVDYSHRQVLEIATMDNLISCYSNKEDPYESIVLLNSHICEMNSGDLAQYGMSALLLNWYLETRTDFYATADPGSFDIVSQYLLRHICQLICNAHAVTELSEDTKSDSNIVTEAQERIATAIYPSASLMNHSCDPTIINSFCGRTLIVRAVKEVKTGGEIFHCYGPHFARLPTPERKSCLKAQYFFDCNCPYCTDPQLKDLNERFWSLACKFCHGALKIINTKIANCKDCNKEQTYSEQVDSEAKAVKLYQDGIEAFKTGDVDSALSLLASSYKLRQKALYKHHLDFADTADWLARVYASVGKYEECITTLEVVVEGLIRRYGDLSIEIGYEARKRSDVLIGALQKHNIETKVKRKLTKKLKDALELTVKIFEIHYGTWSDSYKEAKSRLEIFSGFKF